MTAAGSVGRIVGLDLGERRIGVALSDPLGLSAQPLEVLERRGPVQDVRAIAALVKTHDATAVVVGVPYTLSGGESEQTQRVLAFVERLRAVMQAPIHLVDERLTSVQGERDLIAMGTRREARRKGRVDQVAAQLILQTYLEMHRHA
ncbi:MAG: Holliday junction resolvase RuvX [Candidatus Omnitrophica bacterium]|nr:Holliday junction resolvase RuvX [Candidatus Omnitrophota bacterium]